MKILVTGGCGFLGRNAIEYLLSSNHDIRCMDIVHNRFIDELGVEFCMGDMTNVDVVDSAVNGVDAIVHLACNVIPKTSNDNPSLDVVTNIGGTIRLLDSAVKYRIKRFVFISSGGTVYGTPEKVPILETHPTNPDCSYGITKLAIEKYLGLYFREKGLATCALRLANLYGEYQRFNSGQGAVAVFCHKALAGEPIDIWGDGSVVRDYVYVHDVVKGIEKALCRESVVGEVNIGSGEGTSINELLDAIESVVGGKTKRRYLPPRTFDVPVNVLDIAKAETELGWHPEVSLLDGIKRTISWMKSCNQHHN